MVVDDSGVMRKMVMTRLSDSKMANFEFVEAVDGKDALTKFDPKEIDIGFVDWNMPEMNGLEFIEAVRSDPHFERLKLVMVTTETEPARMARALMAGADEFVMKPFTAEILVDKFRLIGLNALST